MDLVRWDYGQKPPCAGPVDGKRARMERWERALGWGPRSDEMRWTGAAGIGGSGPGASVLEVVTVTRVLEVGCAESPLDEAGGLVPCVGREKRGERRWVMMGAK